MRDAQKHAGLLEALGWSQDSIGRVIGLSRPTVKLLLLGEKTNLPVETYAKLEALASLNMTQQEFQNSAFDYYTHEFVWKTAYKNLAYRETAPITTNTFGKGEQE